MIVYLISDDLKMHELLAGGLKELLTGDTVIAAFPLRKAKMMIAHRKPSVIVLDIDAGEQFDAAAYIKELCPRYSIPIIVVTASKSPQSALLSAGAIDIILHQSGTAADEKLLQRVSTSIISSVSIIKPRFYPQKISDCERVIVIGGSTGSTNALPVVLKGLPADCPPVVCVLHMPEGYTKIYATQLDAALPMKVTEAVSGTYLKRGMVIIAAGGKHLRVFRDKKGYFVTSEAGVKVNGHCPSVDVLFDSAAYAAKKERHRRYTYGYGQ